MSKSEKRKEETKSRMKQQKGNQREDCTEESVRGKVRLDHFLQMKVDTEN